MHIPDAYLSPVTEAAMFGVMIPLWAIAGRRTARELTTKQAPLLSIGAAFCFAVQMFNIPAVGGTTAHALGSTLLAILVGPWAAMLGLTLSLTIQALLFGDGGILTLGANCWDMGFVACFVGWGIYRSVSGRSELGSPRRIVAAGMGAFGGTVAASFSAGMLLGIQPAIAHDAAGHALYCPFGLNIAVPAMVMSHLLVAGPADAIITVAALAYLWRTFPEYALPNARPRIGSIVRIVRVLAVILILTPIGLIASGDAWGEWDMSTLKKMIGYTPQGIAKSHELIHPALPDYGFAGMEGKPWEIAGYLVSALVGCCVVAAFTRIILRRPVPAPIREAAPGHETASLPEWLGKPNPPMGTATRSKGAWLERTLLHMRSTVEKTIASETVARSPGLLQSMAPLAKTFVFLCLLLATGFAASPWLLMSVWGLALATAWASRVPMPSLLGRVATAVLFFGLVVAAPASLAFVTSGPVAFRALGVAFSRPGLASASMILLRLGAGISLAIVWNLTTKWFELLRSFGSIGVPRVFLTTATLTYRYLFVMMETLGEMVEARTARQVGAYEKHEVRTYAGAGSAILFAKSLAFTEEMHLAMQSREFDGAVKTPTSLAWRTLDAFGVLVAVGALALALMTRFGHAV